MRITSKGQVTIPARIREEAGLMPNTEVEFSCDADGNVRIFRATKNSKNKREKRKKPTRGERVVAHLTGRAGDIKMSTDELMALLRGD